MHPGPNAFKKDLARTTSILERTLLLKECRQLIANFFGTFAAFGNVIENVAVRISTRQCSARSGKVTTEPALATTMFALDSVVPITNVSVSYVDCIIPRLYQQPQQPKKYNPHGNITQRTHYVPWITRLTRFDLTASTNSIFVGKVTSFHLF